MCLHNTEYTYACAHTYTPTPTYICLKRTYAPGIFEYVSALLRLSSMCYFDTLSSFSYTQANACLASCSATIVYGKPRHWGKGCSVRRAQYITSWRACTRAPCILCAYLYSNAQTRARVHVSKLRCILYPPPFFFSISISIIFPLAFSIPHGVSFSKCMRYRARGAHSIF